MNRVKFIRDLMQLSRQAMQSLHNIPASSIERWEQGQIPSLSSCEKIIAAAKSHGIDASLEWLLHGIGANPIMAKSSQTENSPAIIQKLIKSTKQPRQLYEAYEVIDDAMAPHYQTGEWLITQKIRAQEARLMHGQICVVDTSHGRHLRLVKQQSLPDLFDLVIANPKSNAHSFYDVKLLGIATILCHYLN